MHYTINIMKTLKNKFLITLLIIPILASCGGNISSWPYVDLNFNVEDVSGIYIDYVNRKDSSLSYNSYTDQSEGISKVYKFLESFHINEKTTAKDLSDYNRKISIYFICENKTIYDFKAYYYSGATTYFMLNDEITLFTADFGSAFSNFMEQNNSYFSFY